MWWFIEESAAREMQRLLDSGPRPTAEQLSELDASVEARDGPRGMNVAGSVAEISVSGPLFARYGFLAWLFDGSAYTDIQAAIAAARTDPTVKEVVFKVDSPGGDVNGLFDTLAAIESLREEKKVSVRAARAQSAAYAIAAAAGPIHAVNAASSFGSIGVVASYFLDAEVVEVTNTESPGHEPHS
jgi:ClpP class serine protease